MKRRDLLRLAGFSALVAGTPALAALIQSEPVENLIGRMWADQPIKHPIFAHHRLPGAEWKAYGAKFNYEIEDAARKEAAQKGIDIDAEILAAMRQESIVEAEQKYLQCVKEMTEPTALFVQSKVPSRENEFIYAGGEFSRFVDMILDRAGNRNTAIISPTALTMIQCEGASRLVRTEMGRDYAPGLRLIGRLDRRINVVVDTYADDGEPVLLGYVPQDLDKRMAALVQTGVTTFELGLVPGFDIGWQAVGVDTMVLHFA
jgi:hypothetical protein